MMHLCALYEAVEILLTMLAFRHYTSSAWDRCVLANSFITKYWEKDKDCIGIHLDSGTGFYLCSAGVTPVIRLYCLELLHLCLKKIGQELCRLQSSLLCIVSSSSSMLIRYRYSLLSLSLSFTLTYASVEIVNAGICIFFVFILTIC